MGFTDEPAADAWTERGRQVERVGDRLRSIGIDRLGRPDEAGVSLADDVHRVCVLLAAATQESTGADQVEPPRLADLASADQWCVIAQEFVAVHGGDPGPGAEQAQLAADLIDASLRDLRQRL